MEQSEQACIAKYNSARQRLVESNEECASLRGALAQRERDLTHERDVVSRLTGERDKVSSVIRVEFQDQLASQSHIRNQNSASSGFEMCFFCYQMPASLVLGQNASRIQHKEV